MPTYDYVCDSCAHEFEAFESIKADPQKTCPSCKADTLRRKIGAGAAILFKGSGFYQTDYRSESYKAKAKADSSNNAPSSGTSTGDGGKSSTSSGSGSTPSSTPSSSTPSTTS